MKVWASGRCLVVNKQMDSKCEAMVVSRSQISIKITVLGKRKMLEQAVEKLTEL